MRYWEIKFSVLNHIVNRISILFTIFFFFPPFSNIHVPKNQGLLLAIGSFSSFILLYRQFIMPSRPDIKLKQPSGGRKTQTERERERMREREGQNERYFSRAARKLILDI